MCVRNLAGCCQKLQKQDLFPPERGHGLLGAHRGVDVSLRRPIDPFGPHEVMMPSEAALATPVTAA
jgi:hypothetical protein